jgi:hypothetical protein
MSVQAIVWVLEDCPDLPPHLVAPLLGLANHADENGKGAYCSTDTVSWYTRKGRDAAKADLDKLEELQLIRRGDQRRVLHLPADKRPVVFDLAMEKRRDPRPDRPGPGRPRKVQVSPAPEIGGVCTPPGFSDPKSGGSTAEIGGVYSRNRGGLQTPRTVLEPSLNQTPALDLGERVTARTPRPRSGEAEQDPNPSGVTTVAGLAAEMYDTHGWSRPRTIYAIEQAMKRGHTLTEVEAVVRRAAADPDTRTPQRILAVPTSWWTDAARTTQPPRPPWCQQCHEDTRLVATDTAAYRCPRCHPYLTGPTP